MEKKLIYLVIRRMLGTLSRQENLFTLVKTWKKPSVRW